MSTTMNSGTMEIRNAYDANMRSGLISAGLIHLMVVSVLMINSAEEIVHVGVTRCGLPKTLVNVPMELFNYHPTIAPKFVPARADIGIPVPIPDAEVNPEAITQNVVENGDPQGTFTGNGNESGTGTEGSIGTEGGTEEAPPMDFIAGIEKYPVVLSNPAPLYPDIARKAGIEGTVFVKMWVAKDGSVKRAEVVKSSSELFEHAAVEAARQWKFVPAIMNNAPVSVFVTVPFKFRLRAS
jgi:TonB family protein